MPPRLNVPLNRFYSLSTYSFSPITGLILKHEIERIYPAPHSALVDSIRATILRLMGIKAPENPNPTIGGLHSDPCTATAPVLNDGARERRQK